MTTVYVQQVPFDTHDKNIDIIYIIDRYDIVVSDIIYHYQ